MSAAVGVSPIRVAIQPRSAVVMGRVWWRGQMGFAHGGHSFFRLWNASLGLVANSVDSAGRGWVLP